MPLMTALIYFFRQIQVTADYFTLKAEGGGALQKFVSN